MNRNSFTLPLNGGGDTNDNQISLYGSIEDTDASIRDQQLVGGDKREVSISKTPPKPAVRRRTYQQQQLQQAPTRAPDIRSSPIPGEQEIQEIEGKQQKPIDELVSKQTSSKTNATISLPLPDEPHLSTTTKPNRPYPKKVFFIIASEFCERFSYYGLRAVLVLYFRSVLNFSDANSTVSFHLFVTLCYLTPILGAVLGDSVWGRFKTILYLSIVYLIGEITLVVASVYWNLNATSVSATFLGLFLIGVGTGGIKPCVSALGGDQFLPNEDKWRQTFFSLFYGAINLGSLVSMFVTPMLRSNYQCADRADCFPYAFGLPALLMFIAIVLFLMAKNHYNLVPLPEKNVIVAFCQCTWLALKRKVTGYKLPELPQPLAEYTSSSSLSVSSAEETNSRNSTTNKKLSLNPQKQTTSFVPGSNGSTGSSQKLESRIKHNTDARKKKSHWLYLASDQFGAKSIEEFRSVLAILLLFVPLPVYWCLYDQQGSLWTLQATRMDGKILNTGFILQPDQMSVANPVLLLAAIPVFEFLVYPTFSRCNLLKDPIQRMTVGGLLAALTFVVSSLIEVRIQQFSPPMQPPAGRANLILVNGLSECYLVDPTISYVPQLPINIALNQTTTPTAAYYNNNQVSNHSLQVVHPFSSQSVEIYSANGSFLSNYQLKFKLTDTSLSAPFSQQHQKQSNSGNSNLTVSVPIDRAQNNNKPVGCPFGSQTNHEFSIAPLADKSVKLLYLDQGNGKLSYKLFNESLEMPPTGRARVRLLFEFFGSSAQAERRQFYLIRYDTNNSSAPTKHQHQQHQQQQRIEFKFIHRDGQVLVSDYLDITSPPEIGDYFALRTNDNLIGPNSPLSRFPLKSGTRNLIILNQRDHANVELKHELLQDNNYRISILYQLVPYLMISVSEVMFSITGLEFSYSMAPDNMKSVILAAWSLTTAFGNLLTVVVESMHLFSNLSHNFLFYAAIMALNMILFAIIGYKYKPNREQKESEDN